MDDGFNFPQIDSFGCVLVIEEIPHLYIVDQHEVLEGIPFFDDNKMYTTLDEDELIIVGVCVKDPGGIDLFDVREIDDENYDELTYTVTPLKFYTIKTPGLTNEDMMDLDVFDILVNNLIDNYIDNLGV